MDEMERRSPDCRPVSTYGRNGETSTSPAKPAVDLEPTGVINETSLSGMCARTRWPYKVLTL